LQETEPPLGVFDVLGAGAGSLEPNALQPANETNMKRRQTSPRRIGTAS
jgi:hypothetical protein